MDKLKKICNENKEIILYLIFGGLTTLVNILTYTILSMILNIDLTYINVIAWVVSVIFAYIVNKFFVFSSNNIKGIKKILSELATFIGARVISLVIFDILIFSCMINVFKINDIITKLVTQVLIVVFNYVLSKFIVFKKNK